MFDVCTSGIISAQRFLNKSLLFVYFAQQAHHNAAQRCRRRDVTGSPRLCGSCSTQTRTTVVPELKHTRHIVDLWGSMYLCWECLIITLYVNISKLFNEYVRFYCAPTLRNGNAFMLIFYVTNNFFYCFIVYILTTEIKWPLIECLMSGSHCNILTLHWHFF